MVQEEIGLDEHGVGLSAGALVATAIGAGVIAYLIRRARAAEAEKARRPLSSDWLRPTEIRDRTATATKDFVVDHLLPEIKPVLLEMLKDARSYVDDGFRRIEKAIRAL